MVWLLSLPSNNSYLNLFIHYMSEYLINLIKTTPYDIQGIRPEDYVFGSVSPIERFDLFSGIFKRDYLPSPERQSNRLFDSYSCVTFSFINSIEVTFKRLIELGRITPDNIQWLEDNGYFINNEVNFSDRFLAVLSGTTPQYGNSGAAVAQYARDLGLAPQTLCDFPGDYTELMYYDRLTISDKAKEVALEFKNRFNIQYEWVRETEWNEASKYGTLEFFTYAWFKDKDGVRYYNPKPDTSNHAICECDIPNNKIFDTYEPFIKQMTKKEDFLDFALAIYITDKNYNKTMSTSFVIKDENSKTVGVFTPADTEEILLADCRGKGVETPKNSNGSTDWGKLIKGTFKKI